MADESPLARIARAADAIAVPESIPEPVPAPLPDQRRAAPPFPDELDGGHPGSENPTWKVGLVLAGGGAKGGYELGAIEALAAGGTQVHAVAGTSIGALNGAVVAGSSSLAEAAARLGPMWERFTGAIGSAPFGSTRLEDDVLTESVPAQAANALPRLIGLFSRRGLLEQLVEEAVDAQFPTRARPFFVAAYPVLPPFPIPIPHARAQQYLADAARRLLGDRSRILHINAMTAVDARLAVLASAALPLMFPARRIETTFFRDGMLGGDNVPIRALVASGCRIVIVVHLSQQPKMRIAEHPDLTLLEIRPRRPLQPGGPLGGLSGPLDFSPERFALLRRRGREDTQAILSDLHAVLRSVAGRRAAQMTMLDSLARLEAPITFPEA